MSSSLFVVREGEEPLPLRASGFESEAALQGLVARIPELLAGVETSVGVPRRLLLVAREPGVPDVLDGGTRWSLDHLFLDQDAVPNLVEVKLVRDSRIRRHVIGQMLDYAANAVVYWPIERLRELYQQTCRETGRDPDQTLADCVGPDADPDVFWGQAETNLRSGRLRMIFVADEIPRELRRVIEFLNGQMAAEMIGIEVKQYVAADLTTLSASLVGLTAEAEARKSPGASRPSKRWDADSFFAALAETRPDPETTIVRALYDWVGQHGWAHSFGTGAMYGSWIPVLQARGATYRPVTVSTSGSLTINFQSLATRPPFDKQETRVELLSRLNRIPGVSIPAESIDDRYPSIPLATLVADPAALTVLIETLEWVVETALLQPHQR